MSGDGRARSSKRRPDRVDDHARREREQEWFSLENRLIDGGYVSAMGPSAAVVYMALCRRTNATAWAVISTRQMCRDTGLGETAYRTAIRRLERLGLLRVTYRVAVDVDGAVMGQRSNQYLLLVVGDGPPADWDELPQPVREEAILGD